MLYRIKNRCTGAVQWEGEIEATADTAEGVKLGLAVRAAVKAGASLAGANLAGADLAGADLADVNLAGANIARANLADADLAHADLTGADLMGADLAGANLAGANLTGANLTGTYLTGADLAGTYLAGADLGERRFVVSGGFDRRGYNFMAIVDAGVLLVTAGCRRWSSFDEARAHYGDNYSSNGDRAECLARIALMEDQVKARAAESAGILKMGGGDAE